MIWAQGAVCFVVWVAYGLLLRRRATRWAAGLSGAPRGLLVFLASGGLIVPAGLLLGALYLIGRSGGLQDGAMTPWAMVLVTLLGVAFVHCQTASALAMALLVSRPETGKRARPSQSSETSTP